MSTISAGNTTTTAFKVTADTTGNLVFATGGANTTALTIDNTQTATFKSQGISRSSLPAGCILQVVQATTTTSVNATSSTYSDTTLTATITPISATSKILVMVNQAIGTSGSGNVGNIKLVRNSTDVQTWGFGIFYTGASDLYGYFANTYLDSPANTSAVTYKTQFNRTGGTGSTRVQYSDANGNQLSTITLMEVAA